MDARARFRCHIVRAIALITAAAAGAGCASANLATRFYVLTPSAPAATAARPPASGRDVTVGVGPIILPTYLDRPQIVTRTGQDEIELAEFDLWAEPLQSAVPRVMAENLAAGIATQHVVVFPWRGRRIVQYQVAVDILRFEATAVGDAMLRARWRLLDADGQELAIRTVALTERTGGSGYGTIVAALSRLLGALSAEISDAIVTGSRDSAGTSTTPFRHAVVASTPWQLRNSSSRDLRFTPSLVQSVALGRSRDAPFTVKAARSIGGSVSEWHGQSDQPRSTGVAQAPGFVRRTTIKLSGRVNELTDGTVCAVGAAKGGGNRSISEIPA